MAELVQQVRFNKHDSQVSVDEILAQCNGEYSSSNPLKVTILTPTWNGWGGSIIMIRELAKQLAKFPQLKVTVLVSKRDSEHEKREAESLYNLTIIEAKKQPGFVDPIEWLNFSPAELSTDIVVGFGEELGKIAQYWKERNQCKTMHIFSDPYKLLERYVDLSGLYSEKIIMGLCEVADICVATGSKMSERLSAYLRYQNKKVFNLTPGIISDFCDTKYDSKDGGKFRVLFVGGDNPDNFLNEGLEIAAKAVTELNNNSYHLIYVGAGKETKHQFSKLFQAFGFAKRQLEIRSLPKDDEEWKRLFCEVDLAIMPSGEKEFGWEALLALSAGLPGLVHGDSGFGEALKEMTLGTLSIVDSDVAAEWATKIKKVKETDRKTRLDGAAKLRSYYDEKYSWEKQCEALVGMMIVFCTPDPRGKNLLSELNLRLPSQNVDQMLQKTPVEFFGIPLNDQILLQASPPLVLGACRGFVTDEVYEQHFTRFTSGNQTPTQVLKSFFGVLAGLDIEAQDKCFDAIVKTLRNSSEDGFVDVVERLEKARDTVSIPLANNNEVIGKVSERVGSLWKRLARDLELGEGRIDNISDEENDDQDCCYKALKTWCQFNGEDATIRKFMIKLTKTGLAELNNDIMRCLNLLS